MTCVCLILLNWLFSCLWKNERMFSCLREIKMKKWKKTTKCNFGGVPELEYSWKRKHNIRTWFGNIVESKIGMGWCSGLLKILFVLEMILQPPSYCSFCYP